MKFIEQVVSFGKDLGLFLIYSCGYCTSVFFDYTISWIPPIYGTLIRTITFFRTLLFAPIRIIIKVVLQLFLLPVNIPLRLFLGTSLKGILLFATSWTDGYVIFTILQYWLALTIFGVSIGAVCGTSQYLTFNMENSWYLYWNTSKILETCTIFRGVGEESFAILSLRWGPTQWEGIRIQRCSTITPLDPFIAIATITHSGWLYTLWAASNAKV